MVLSQNLGLTLGLLSLVSIAGAGIAVGSGIGLMAHAMVEEEAKTSAVAHTPVEKKITINRGFAAGNQ
eukprot:CAMPEP_0206148720 /NCGR_PEP_ID=MMETSP1473-20131121/37401_1 /ASSEMBLY_ACC=CAM_ASM_001109 /TAXON_ID=1461547 /ORGANISM="Stichococcus sp, Strain RCC1054" /LENGTH=67 /DNA_ID=CAMNT_0053546143 /DNA_START=864 /DNA_END=1067 /DNA_ORIENTATION=-